MLSNEAQDASPQTQELAALEARAGELCGTCHGTKLYIKGMEVPQWSRGDGSCPSCQGADGKPTGLRVPELTVACVCIELLTQDSSYQRWSTLGGCESCWEMGDHTRCICQGSGRILKQGAELLLGIEAALGRVGSWSYLYARPLERHSYSMQNRCHFDPSRIEAATQALDAALGAATEEAQHDSTSN